MRRVAKGVVDPDDQWRSAGRLLLVSVGAGIIVGGIAVPLIGAMLGWVLGPAVQVVNIVVFAALGGFSGRWDRRRARLVLLPVPVVAAFALSCWTIGTLDDFGASTTLSPWPGWLGWPLIPTAAAAVIAVTAAPWCLEPVLEGRSDA